MKIVQLPTSKHMFNKAFKEIYTEIRPAYLAYFTGKYTSASREDIEDSFQEAITAFYKKIESGELTELTCSIKTYIYKLGRNKLIDVLRKSGRDIPLEDSPTLYKKINNICEEADDAEEKYKAVYRIIQEMKDPCRTILNLFYYEKESMKSIAIHMDYEGPDVAKTRKSACLRKACTAAKDYMRKVGII